MASDTLFTIALAVARACEIVDAGTATGGTTGTLIDTGGLLQQDDHWNKGTVWIVSTTDGEAPEDEWSAVSDFVNTTSTLSLSTALTVAPGSGDGYEIASNLIPLSRIIATINRVLFGVKVPTIDNTSLDIIANTTDYTLPTAIKRGDLMRVRVKTSTANSGTPDWLEIPFKIIEGATGAADTLHLFDQYTAGRDLELLYVARHGAVYARGDTINELIDANALAIHAACECIKSLLTREHKNKYLTGLLNSLLDEKDRSPLTNYMIKKSIPHRPIEHRSNV